MCSISVCGCARPCSVHVYSVCLSVCLYVWASWRRSLPHAYVRRACMCVCVDQYSISIITMWCVHVVCPCGMPIMCPSSAHLVGLLPNICPILVHYPLVMRLCVCVCVSLRLIVSHIYCIWIRSSGISTPIWSANGMYMGCVWIWIIRIVRKDPVLMAYARSMDHIYTGSG